MFACMIDMDHADYALCNVLSFEKGDFNWTRFLDFQRLEPLREQECRTCRILPICQGGCAYCRMQGDDVCHDLKDCIEDFVLDYHEACKHEEAELK